MKKIIITIAAFSALLILFAVFSHATTPATVNHYALTTKVVELDRVNDVVTCEDTNGNLVGVLRL